MFEKVLAKAESPEKLNPDSRAWKGDLYLKDLVLRPKGKAGEPWRAWTKGVVLHSGDCVFRGARPFSYVLKRK